MKLFIETKFNIGDIVYIAERFEDWFAYKNHILYLTYQYQQIVGLFIYYMRYNKTDLQTVYQKIWCLALMKNVQNGVMSVIK